MFYVVHFLTPAYPFMCVCMYIPYVACYIAYSYVYILHMCSCDDSTFMYLAVLNCNTSGTVTVEVTEEDK